MVTLSETFHEFDKLEQQTLLQYTLTMMRETLLSLSGADDMLRSRNGEHKFVLDFSKVMNVDKIEKTNQLVTDASYHLERNGSAKMIFWIFLYSCQE